jgi:hypothetical protein
MVPVFCPTCGQRMLLRFGARLSPHLADIFDMIERAGDRGVRIEAIVGALYAGKPTAAARQAVKTNIVHINERLEETDRRIRMVPPRVGAYRLITVAPRQVIKIERTA